MPTQRNDGVDLIRVIAAFGVILIHLAPSTPAAEVFTRFFFSFAVPFFLVVSLHFFLGRLRRQTVIRPGDWRVDRILVPYAAWTVIYTALRCVKFRLRGESPALDLVDIVFYGGAALHLYFLPLLLLLQTMAFALLLALRRQTMALGFAAAAGVFGFFGSAHFGFSHALERGALYVALAWLLGRLQESLTGRRFNVAFGALTLAAMLAVAFYGYPTNGWGLVLGPLIGYGVAALALNWRFAAANRALRWVLTCSYGIYLAHFALLEAFEVAKSRTPYALTPFSIGIKVVVASVLFLGCLVFMGAVRRQRQAAYVLLGEGSLRRNEALA